MGNLAVDWTYSLDPASFSSPAVANGVLYVGSSAPSGSVYAFNASSGALLWKSAVSYDSQIISSPAVANGVVYIGNQDDYTFYAFDAGTGARLWTYTTGGYIGSSPAVSNGVVYFASWNADHNRTP